MTKYGEFEWGMSYDPNILPDPKNPPKIPGNAAVVDIEYMDKVIGHITSITVEGDELCVKGLVKERFYNVMDHMINGRLAPYMSLKGFRIVRRGGVDYISGGVMNKVRLHAN